MEAFDEESAENGAGRHHADGRAGMYPCLHVRAWIRFADAASSAVGVRLVPKEHVGLERFSL